MRVTQEIVTVLADPPAGEVNVVLAGHRIALSIDEAVLLADGVTACLERLRAQAAAPGGAPPEVWQVQRAPGEADAMQQRTRALIQATMREKGLALREDGRE